MEYQLHTPRFVKESLKDNMILSWHAPKDTGSFTKVLGDLPGRRFGKPEIIFEPC